MNQLGGEKIRGILLPINTPFDEKVRVDEQIMRQLVDFHIGAGVQGLFVLGSTGQGPAMTVEECKQAATVALDQAKSRMPLREVFRMGGFDVKRFPKSETEQMPKEEVAKLERELREAGILGQ